MDIEAERKKFEAWAMENLSYPRLEMVLDRYIDPYTFARWQAWQAAVARCESADDGKARLDLEGIEDES